MNSGEMHLRFWAYTGACQQKHAVLYIIKYYLVAINECVLLCPTIILNKTAH